jgi:hypothetical protein
MFEKETSNAIEIPVQGSSPVFLNLKSLISRYHLVFPDEATLQAQFESILVNHGISFVREFKLSGKDRPDFYLKNTGSVVELKVESNLNKILRPLHRYAAYEQVQEVILVCPRPFSLPPVLNGKPMYCISLYKSML